jgi:hypothetical protein
MKHENIENNGIGKAKIMKNGNIENIEIMANINNQ